MLEFLNAFANGTTMQKGILVMIGGMAGVFFVLIIFYLLIKAITKLFPYKEENSK